MTLMSLVWFAAHNPFCAVMGLVCLVGGIGGVLVGIFNCISGR